MINIIWLEKYRKKISLNCKYKHCVFACEAFSHFLDIFEGFFYYYFN